jgi:glutamine synthetase
LGKAPVRIEWTSEFDERVRHERARLVDAGVKYCFATWVDIHGRSKAKFVPICRFEELARGSETYTVQAFEGMGDLGPHDDDQAVVPDLDSLVICPWDRRHAWMAGDIYWRGEPYEYCSRSILKRWVARAAEMGFGMMLGIEPEFYILREVGNGGIVPFVADDKGPSWAYDVESTLDAIPILEVIHAYLEELGWDVASFDHEGGHGQYEFDFGFTDALAMCDRFTFLRLLLKEVAKRFGAFATFMPKPFADDFRSGAHFNMSLVDIRTGENLMAEPHPHETGFSSTTYHFVAGQLRHADAITAVCCPTVNSYKGLVSGGVDPSGMLRDMSWAPVYTTFGDNNRAAMIRLPLGRPCVENRATDMAMNVYWGTAISLGAGLEGIRDALDPGPPTNQNLYECPPNQLESLGIRLLPRTLAEALDAFREDPLTEEVFGAGPKRAFLEAKAEEWHAYHATVSEWERERYLRFF